MYFNIPVSPCIHILSIRIHLPLLTYPQVLKLPGLLHPVKVVEKSNSLYSRRYFLVPQGILFPYTLWGRYWAVYHTLVLAKLQRNSQSNSFLVLNFTKCATAFENLWNIAQLIELPNGKHLSTNQHIFPLSGSVPFIINSAQSPFLIGTCLKVEDISDLPI